MFGNGSSNTFGGSGDDGYLAAELMGAG